MEQQQQTRIRNPPFRLQLVLPSSEPQQSSILLAAVQPQPLAQLQQLRRIASSSAVVRPGSSDSGIADCPIQVEEETGSSPTSGASQASPPPVCRICLSSLASVGPSAAANCGHVACLPCLLKWYRSQSVCFCCRTITTGFTLLYL